MLGSWETKINKNDLYLREVYNLVVLRFLGPNNVLRCETFPIWSWNSNCNLSEMWRIGKMSEDGHRKLPYFFLFLKFLITIDIQYFMLVKGIQHNG